MMLVSLDNGKKAVELFEKEPEGTFDAILMDIQMPIMNGYEAASAIRKLDKSDAKKVAIYAVSANAFQEDITAALSAGMDGHIAKPINSFNLYEILDHICHD